VTIVDNSAGYGGGFCCCNGSSPILVNCILWNNTPQGIYIFSGSVTATYSDIQEGWTGTGNINTNPQFSNPNVDNYHINHSSPCSDTGNPDPMYNDYDGSRNDMGAFGGPGGRW